MGLAPQTAPAAPAAPGRGRDGAGGCCSLKDPMDEPCTCPICAAFPVRSRSWAAKPPGPGIPHGPAGVGLKHPGLSVVCEQKERLRAASLAVFARVSDPAQLCELSEMQDEAVERFLPLLCLAATGDRGAQRVPRRGGDFPGVLCLGAADHTNADSECVSVGALLGLLRIKVLAQSFLGELWKRSLLLCKSI